MANFGRRVTTGLTGLSIEPEPHRKLTTLYNRILKVLTKMPAEAEYRVNTQAIVKNRLQLVQTNPNIGLLEEKINCGCIEEVLKQAERELFLARTLIMYKPWQPLVAEPPKDQFQWPPN